MEADLSGRKALRQMRRMRQRPLETFDEVRAAHGDVACFKVGPEHFFLLSHPEHAAQVLLPARGQALPEKGRALKRVRRLLGNGLLTSEGDFHMRQRRLSQPAFQPRNLDPYAAIMVRDTREITDGWQEGSRVDLEVEMNSLTLRIAGEAMFGTDLRGREAEIGAALTETRSQFILGLHPLAPIFERLPIPPVRRFDRARAVIADVVTGVIAERRAAEAAGAAPGGDLLSLLLGARDTEGDGTGMSDEQLHDEAMTLLLAGHETTANALAWTFHLLAGAPDARARLHAELDEVLGGAEPTAADVSRLPYAKAVFCEALRLCPPGPALARRLTEATVLQPPAGAPAGTAPVALPAGAEVLLPQWTIQRDPRWWGDDAELFRPERFLADAPGASERPRFAWFPFGGGRRVCIGQGFAMMEGILVMAAIAQRYDLESVPGVAIEPDAQFTVRPRNGLPMTVRSRAAR